MPDELAYNAFYGTGTSEDDRPEDQYMFELEMETDITDRVKVELTELDSLGREVIISTNALADFAHLTRD